MTAKEMLRGHIESLSEEDAEKALRLLGDRLDKVDPLLLNPDVLALEDEPLSREDKVLVEEGREDAAEGRVVSREEIQSRYG